MWACWDFNWDCAEFVEQFGVNWYLNLNNVKSTDPWTWYISVIVWAGLTKYHRLSGLKNRVLFSYSSVGWEVQHQISKVDVMLMLLFSWLVGSCHLTVCLHDLLCAEREKQILSCPFCKGHKTNFIIRASPSLSHLNPVTSPRSHYQIPLHWELGLQHMNLSGGAPQLLPYLRL